MDDSELLAKFLKGSHQAFKELVQRHQAPLYNFIWQQLGNDDDVKEICQLCFIQVYRKAQQFQGRSSVKSWLYKIAMNLCKNHYRARSRQRIDHKFDLDRYEVDGEDTGVQQCMALEKREQIKTVIMKLPYKQRTTIELRFFHECTLKQVAEIMDCPIGTAKANYHHALTALRALIKGEQYE